MEKEFDFESFKQEAIKGMYAGKPLNGEKGIFAPLLKHFLEAALAGELETHLQEEKAAGRSDWPAISLTNAGAVQSLDRWRRFGPAACLGQPCRLRAPEVRRRGERHC